ncbi:MAG: 23S rRNA (adenine(2503)-C(2))-methyltransferase RlmN [Clostridia bacterium]|nr:23S rRNA (adenine(2503)-C(2))-methyltransferase RlmN [Clostridia bacterium]
MINLLGKDENFIASVCAALSLPGYRARQIYGWSSKGVSVEDMTNLPLAVRSALTGAGYGVMLPEIAEKYVSRVDGTVKYLMRLGDGEMIESVVMSYRYGKTICVSCQAGCRMGCRFCASTLNGLKRNLTCDEILGQVYAASRDVGERISGIVMMGIGEPLDNYDSSVAFIRAAGNPDGLNIGMRHISLSTCGIVPGILGLADEDLPVTLSVSLHSIDTEKRKKIMPVTNAWSVEEILSACRCYFEKTGRRISFEYTLIAGENDSEEDARQLATGLKKHLGRIPLHVNLIPLNPVSERDLRKSGRENVDRFKRNLVGSGVNATVRRRLGPDINASCGQLRYSRALSERNNE